MVKIYSILKSTACKEPAQTLAERFYTVGYMPQKAQNPTPKLQLNIKGRWLEAFGFTTGQPVMIDAQPGLLFIRIEGLS